MSIKIGRGLFKYDFIDQHAILGLPVDAEIKQVRQRYIGIARVLHPDSCKAETEVQKKQATQMLSKIINPAYEQLSQDRHRKEYGVMLKRMGQRLAGEAIQLNLHTEEAKQLVQAGANLDLLYKNGIQKLSADQYKEVLVEKILESIANISELNMVYLMRKESKGEAIRTPAAAAPRTTPSNPAAPGIPKPPAPAPRVSLADPYIRRGEEYLEKNNFAQAIQELREGLQMDQTSSSCHGLLGLAFLKQNQPTMAKVHINRALQINPQEPSAIKARDILNRLSGQSAKSSPAKPAPGNSKKPPDNKSGGGGFLRGMFDGKKK
jgi:curved DNA-binding protein CbpA